MKRILSLLTVIAVVSGMLTAVPVSALENAALNKPTAASSVYAAGTTGPANINDGNRRNYFASGGAVLEGTVGGNQFVRVDLQETYDIDSVVLYTRVDLDDGRYRKNLAVEFSNTVDFAQKESIQAIGNEPVGFKESITVDLNLKRPYRYVRVVQTAGDSLLVLAEVEVFGEKAAAGDTDSVPAQYPDAAESIYAGPIRLLQMMDVMTGIDETSFGVNKIVSRGQAVDAIVKAASPDYPNAGKHPFTDVDETFWAADSLNKAWAMGIVKGDGNGNFRPGDPVSNIEAVTMMLRALGYASFLETRNSVSEVVSAAKSAGLINSLPSDEYIGRGAFAKLLVQMLQSDMAMAQEISGGEVRCETKTTLLEERHGILLYEGVVKQNRYSHLSYPKPSFGNNVIIGAEALLDPGGILDGYLGFRVEYAVKKDAPDHVFAAWPRSTETVTILAEELDSSIADVKNNTVRVLRKNDKKESYSLAPARDILYNGVSYPGALPEDLLISSGELTLIDNDKDGIYDTVSIWTYRIMELSTVGEKGEDILLTDIYGNTETLKKEYTLVYYCGGAETKTGKIKAGRVLRLYQSKDKMRSRVILLDNTITGEAEGITQNESITISGKEYEFSAGFQAVDNRETFALGDTITLYLDETGKAEWISKDASKQTSSWVIGFSQKINLAKSMSDRTQMRIFNENGEFVTLPIADKVFVDGQRMTHSELTDKIKADSKNFVLEFVRYQTGESGEISRLDTMYQGPREDSETMSFYRKNTGGSMVTEVNAIYNGQTYVMPAKGDTATFVIPQVDGSFTDDPEYDYVYEIKPLSHVIFNHNDNGSTTVSSYMLGDTGFPKFFANIKEFKGGGSGLNFRLVSDVNSMSVLLVESMNKAVRDGTDGYYINGRNLKTGKTERLFAESDRKLFETGKVFQEKPEWLDANLWLDESKIFAADQEILKQYVSDFSTLSLGDIIGCELGSDRVSAIERLYRYEKTQMPELQNNVWYSGGQHPKWFFSLTRLQTGTVENIDKVSVTFQPKEGMAERFYLSSFFGALYVIDSGRGKITTESGTNLGAHMDGKTKFMYLCSAGTPVCIVAYPYD